ncbi:hypothetical protein V1511DRAFT_503431 [Dipodascopsis uninucleata]
MLKQPPSSAAPTSPSATGSSNDSIKSPANKTDGRESLPPSLNPGKQSQTLCRNIVIHGYCKFEHSGCIFRHDTTPTKPVQSASKIDTTLKKKLNVDSPSFMPSSVSTSSKPTTLSAQSVDAAPFVPRINTPTSLTEFVPSYMNSPEIYTSSPSSTSNQFVSGTFSSTVAPVTGTIGGPMSVDSTLSNQGYDFNSMSVYPQSNQDMFYHATQSANYQPLQYHLYAPLPPHKASLLPYQKTVQGFFLSDNIREELQRKSEATLQILPNSTLPDSLDVYYSLVPLDTNPEKNNRVFGYSSWIYKAFSKNDGNTYALRRIEGFKLTDEKSISIVQQWRRLSNANVVMLFEAFTTRAFGDNSIIFVYDYHPLSSTLSETHFGPSSRYPMIRNSAGQMAPSVPEQVLWSYLVQLSSALKTIHSASLAARCLDPTKIILTSKMRVRISCVGILDVIDGAGDYMGIEGKKKHQQEDLNSLGRLILSIACNNSAISMSSGVSLQVVSKGLDYIGRFYSTDLKNCITYLLNSNESYEGTVINVKYDTSNNIDDFIRVISPFYQQNLNSSLHYQDNLESDLSKELENGRLVRLLCKFGFINERPEFDHDSAWSETGDRYLLKLFRDYVFHQVDENGNPVVDLAHVLRCLNKLDAGVDEKIMLVSRDEQSCLIVSYKELKNCVDAVFRDLNRAAS